MSEIKKEFDVKTFLNNEENNQTFHTENVTVNKNNIIFKANIVDIKSEIDYNDDVHSSNIIKLEHFKEDIKIENDPFLDILPTILGKNELHNGEHFKEEIKIENDPFLDMLPTLTLTNNECNNKAHVNYNDDLDYILLNPENKIQYEDKQFQCKNFNISISKEFSLKQNSTVHIKVNIFTCDYCGKEFKTKSAITKHVVIHLGGRNSKYEICNKIFTQQSTLNSHTKKKSYKCEVCKKIIFQKQHFYKHMRDHTTKKNVICQVCNKGFISKSKLVDHLRCHTGEKPFICKVCDKKFTWKQNLDNHLIRHTNKKPYRCKICYKSFTRKSNMDRHLICHTGNKPFKCSVCNKVFNQRSILSRHMICHTGEKPYLCKVCNNRFNQKSSLYRHIKRRHP